MTFLQFPDRSSVDLDSVLYDAGALPRSTQGKPLFPRTKSIRHRHLKQSIEQCKTISHLSLLSELDSRTTRHSANDLLSATSISVPSLLSFA